MYSLGLEFSTQSVKMAVLDIMGGEVVYTGGFSYDSMFPHYGTSGGILPNEDMTVRHTSPFMFLEALDMAFSSLRNDGIEMHRIKAIKVDAMQHCTVYAGAEFSGIVKKLDPRLSLLEQIGRCFTRNTAPIWEDRSTGREIKFLEETLGGEDEISRETGNRAEHRFPASQIMKWLAASPDEYRRTNHIFLLSAFLSSILSARVMPVDTGDGWGTNLNTCDIKSPAWSRKMISAVSRYAGDKEYINHVVSTLESKLGQMTHYDFPVEKINPYFVSKYGVDSNAVMLAGTGDNPAVLLGCGGTSVISLGSSYTVNGVMDKIIPSESGEYNVFGYTKGRAMALSVFTNGSKVHDHFFEKHGYRAKNGEDADWKRYAAAAGSPVLSSDEPLMLPYLMDESVPFRKSGFVYDGLTGSDAKSEIRSLHVSQVLALKIHSSHLANGGSICLVGGGSRNSFMKQLLADVFGARIYCLEHAVYAAPLGCAISGARYISGLSYEEAAEKYVHAGGRESSLPSTVNEYVVRKLLDRYSTLEKSTG
jgi:xylulokinase